MTNRQIIFNESIRLMEEGIIGTTGRTFSYENADGEIITVKEPEPLHTFAHWKQAGYIVRKGEHAKATIYIWKYGKGKKADTAEDMNADGEQAKGKCFWKKAFFFTFDQVEKIQTKK